MGNMPEKNQDGHEGGGKALQQRRRKLPVTTESTKGRWLEGNRKEKGAEQNNTGEVTALNRKESIQLNLTLEKREIKGKNHQEKKICGDILPHPPTASVQAAGGGGSRNGTPEKALDTHLNLKLESKKKKKERGKLKSECLRAVAKCHFSAGQGKRKEARRVVHLGRNKPGGNWENCGAC